MKRSILGLLVLTGLILWLDHAFNEFLRQATAQEVREVKTDMELAPSTKYWREVL